MSVSSIDSKVLISFKQSKLFAGDGSGGGGRGVGVMVGGGGVGVRVLYEKIIISAK